MVVRVSILGGSGYTGAELLRLLSCRADVEISCITSRQYVGRKVGDVFSSLIGYCDMEFIHPDIDALTRSSDIVFTCVPHQAAMDVVPTLLDRGVKVIDLSADFRLSDKTVYEEWYQEHSCPHLLEEAVYGLPEIYGAEIRKARLVANPGCYPTSAILPLFPLLSEGLLNTDFIIIDSKSGASGAGRGLNTATLFCEVDEAFKAYKVASHRHTPEIEQELSKAAGQSLTINFTPHLVPMSRGILTTIYAEVASGISEQVLREALTDFYKQAIFVKILPEDHFPNVLSVRGTNMCHIGLKVDGRTNRAIIVSAIDNLCRGASGQAVQNMNIMMGVQENTGLVHPGLYP